MGLDDKTVNRAILVVMILAVLFFAAQIIRWIAR